MDLSDDENPEEAGEQYMHFTRNTLLPNEFEWTCFFICL